MLIEIWGGGGGRIMDYLNFSSFSLVVFCMVNISNKKE